MRLTQLTYVCAVLCLLLSSFLRPYGLWKWKLLSPVQLFGIPWDPTDYTDHEILQARILEGVGFPFSRGLPNPGIKSRSPALQADSLPAEPQGKLKDTELIRSSRPRNRTGVSCIAGRFFTNWATREALMYWRLFEQESSRASMLNKADVTVIPGHLY